MRDTVSIIRTALVILIAAVSFFLFWGIADADVYLDSAHGDATKGVNRSALGYPIGFCDHCHEQHTSINNSEPLPTGGGPSDYLLFFENHTTYTNIPYTTPPIQDDNFCFQCHADSGSYAITNLNYSYRAGRWVDSVNDVLETFSYTSPGTSHNLDDIRTFITGKWSYTADSNPCNACHNPHAAQGDPIGTPRTAAKTSILLDRGWPVSRWKLHNTNNNTWGLWGDVSVEKMNNYSGSYQAPYQYNSTSAYEPDGSSTQNGSNLTDYVTFCTDCHDNSNTISSSPLDRNLYKFAWTSEKHGGAIATNDGTYGGTNIEDVIDPYDEDTNYVLSCTDCHEPHGSVNRFLIREGINGGTALTDVEKLASVTPDNTMEWKSLCSKCHNTTTDHMKAVHHRAYEQEFASSYSYCGYCHEPEADDMRNCLQCHYHGSTEWPAVVDPPLGVYPYSKNGSEKMF